MNNPLRRGRLFLPICICNIFMLDGIGCVSISGRGTRHAPTNFWNSTSATTRHPRFQISNTLSRFLMPLQITHYYLIQNPRIFYVGILYNAQCLVLTVFYCVLGKIPFHKYTFRSKQTMKYDFYQVDSNLIAHVYSIQYLYIYIRTVIS